MAKNAHTHKRSDREELFETLYQVASDVRKNAYAPYSNYKVGCAIVSSEGTVFGGCNVENASFGATICAERSALLQMVAAGESTPIACLILTEGEPAPPCGMCRQVMGEFAEDMVVWLTNTGKNRVIFEQSLADLLPGAFRADFLPSGKKGGATETNRKRSGGTKAPKTASKSKK